MSTAAAATAPAPSPVARATVTEEKEEEEKKRAAGNYYEVPFSTHSARASIRSSPRFGTMSHHSFFSRHNPHPHRVRHIQGLNGNPVCMVKDDWGVATSLFPHPLIKSQSGFRGFPLPLNPISPYESCSHQRKPGLLPEAWREELRELAAKVSLASKAKNTPELDTSVYEKPPEEEASRRKTLYSAQTGRIIPPSTKAYQRRTSTQRHAHHPQPLYDQELLVPPLPPPPQPLPPPPPPQPIPPPPPPNPYLHLTTPTSTPYLHPLPPTPTSTPYLHPIPPPLPPPPTSTPYLHPLPPPHIPTLYLHPLPPTSSSTIYPHPLPPTSTSTPCLHPISPPSTSTLYLHHLPPPSTSNIYLHPISPPSTSTLYLQHLPPPPASSSYHHPLPHHLQLTTHVSTSPPIPYLLSYIVYAIK
ncbi:hypothetical protein NHX12_024841 [Muraenolepis orangiensis]|uniref:Uncharacterized protein n=1 Tax=Muraenolepis orangiensis TaxID=630683 RepID=A0A9Q0ELT4_9TELE|nr:hypothetical protein NHX12_024841 [Muraenolepis orangiensis]